jgi:hypothetical protein
MYQDTWQADRSKDGGNQIGYCYNKRIEQWRMSLSSKAHLNLCKIVQSSQEDLVVDTLVVW